MYEGVLYIESPQTSPFHFDEVPVYTRQHKESGVISTTFSLKNRSIYLSVFNEDKKFIDIQDTPINSVSK